MRNDTHESSSDRLCESRDRRRRSGVLVLLLLPADASGATVDEVSVLTSISCSGVEDAQINFVEYTRRKKHLRMQEHAD
jgi:hypothetical protein